MEPLKEQFYSKKYYKSLAAALKSVYPPLDASGFYRSATRNLGELELKARMRRTTEVSRKYLPESYPESLRILYKYSDTLSDNTFSHIFLSDFVAMYGREHYKLSMDALRDFTCYSSSELAVREFLELDFDRTIKAMYKWAKHDDYHVRRLACEGLRSRLPWAKKIRKLQQEPFHALPVLELLKKDPEKYVQKSVANHLNDVSKDHASWMMDVISAWDTGDKHTGWIVKHACRTLIKQGDSRALSLFQVDKNADVKIRNFKLESRQISLGDSLSFSFMLKSASNKKQKLVIDYTILYVKKSGELKPKVFKLKELELVPGNDINIRKKHLFKDFTTRKHYNGKHGLALSINGKVMKQCRFNLSLD